jgi:catechol 2,3-dioxygenase-like lactoylglutathione lyase family enzyme
LPAAGIGILAIDHVQLAMPAGGEPAARRFYGELLGLREVTKPSALVGRGGCWFAGPSGVAVHLGVEDPSPLAARAHPCFVVANLAAAERRLADTGATLEPDDSGLDVDRCYLRDPFGNRIELLDARDAGFSEGG